MNTLKTLFFMGVLSALICAVGGLIAGKSGVMLAFGFSLVMNFCSYWFSAPMALAMSRAQPIERSQVPELYEIVERLTKKAGLPMPKIYLIPTDSPNAFATGRDPKHSAVAVTEGIMRILNWQELEGVLAHELSHVKNRDILITSVAAVLCAVLTSLAHMAQYQSYGYRSEQEQQRGTSGLALILIAIITPLVAMLINLAISRSREYEADASGAHLCGNPLELASALSKLETGVQQAPMTSLNPSLSSLYIVTPNPGMWFANLMSTHPPLPDRIRRLQAMSRTENS